jgi:hypothetical protein
MFADILLPPKQRLIGCKGTDETTIGSIAVNVKTSCFTPMLAKGSEREHDHVSTVGTFHNSHCRAMPLRQLFQHRSSLMVTVERSVSLDGPSLEISIDYSQTLDTMIEAGRYGYVDSLIIEEDFPLTGRGISTNRLVLVGFDRFTGSGDAVRDMTRLRLRPAKIEHLLAYGACHWQGEPTLIVALGSLRPGPSGLTYVPYLDGADDSRCLDLEWWDYGWYPDWRFLAIVEMEAPLSEPVS